MAEHASKDCFSASGTHEIQCCGSRVRISESGIEVLTEPCVEYCPLHETLYGTKQIDADAVRKSVEMKIAGYGFCCKNRAFETDPIVAYGASEMMRVWLESNLIDCAVVVCEGAGTVVVNNSKLAQGIGARLTGIIKTSAIQETITRIEAEGGIVLDPTTARIDQVAGVKRAFDLGHKRIAASVAGFQAKAIDEIREFEKDSGLDALVFSVCNTCVCNMDVKHLEKADVVCASASKILRAAIGPKALLQVGVIIPVYALTQKGKSAVLAYLTQFKDKLVVFRTRKLPYQAGRGPKLRRSAVDQKR